MEKRTRRNKTKQASKHMKTWTLNIEEDPTTGDCILTFPKDLLEEAGWKEGDTLEWIDLGNESWQLVKK